MANRIPAYDYLKWAQDPKYEQPTLYRIMKAEEFTMDYYHESGLSEVLLFDCRPEELGMKMSESLTLKEIEEKVGKNKLCNVITVGTQGTSEAPLSSVIDHMQTPREQRGDLYNLLGNDCSSTPLNDLISPPPLLTSIDWATSWPDPLKFRTISFDRNGNYNEYKYYPSTQMQWNTSPAGAFTNFHNDYSGSTVFMYVQRGEKVWYIAPPTEENVTKYEEWIQSPPDGSFFGDIVDECARIILKDGQTLILPSGWFHAVYTAQDTLSYGGNYLHTRAASTQLRMIASEKRLKLAYKFTYPYVDQTLLYHLALIVKKVTRREYIRPTSRNAMKREYVGYEFMKTDNHHRQILEEDYANGVPREVTIWEETAEYEEYEKLLEDRRVEEGGRDGRRNNRRDKRRSDVSMGKNELVEGEMEEDQGLRDEQNTVPLHNEEKIFYDEDRKARDITGSSNCSAHLSPLCDEPAMNIDRDILRATIHHKEIVDYEGIVVELLNRRSINIPHVISRPNSLLRAFAALVRERREMAVGEEGHSLPATVLPSEEDLSRKDERKRKRSISSSHTRKRK